MTISVRALLIRFGLVSATTLAAISLVASICGDDSSTVLFLCFSLAALALAGIFSLAYPEA